MSRPAMIKEMLERGCPYEEIAKRFKTDVMTISVYDRERLGTLARIDSDDQMPMEDPDPDMSVGELYAAGYSIKQIAKLRHINTLHASALVYADGITPRGSKGPKLVTEDMLAEIVRRYKGSESCNSIARSMGLNPYYVKLMIENMGVRRERGNYVAAIPESEWNRAIGMYKAGANLATVAKSLHTNGQRVSKYFKEHGVMIRRSKHDYPKGEEKNDFERERDGNLQNERPGDAAGD